MGKRGFLDWENGEKKVTQIKRMGIFKLGEQGFSDGEKRVPRIRRMREKGF